MWYLLDKLIIIVIKFPPLYLVIFLALKSILYRLSSFLLNNVTIIYIFSHSFTFNLSAFLYLQYIFCRQHTVEYFLFTLKISAFKLEYLPIYIKVVIDVFEFKFNTLGIFYVCFIFTFLLISCLTLIANIFRFCFIYPTILLALPHLSTFRGCFRFIILICNLWQKCFK